MSDVVDASLRLRREIESPGSMAQSRLKAAAIDRSLSPVHRASFDLAGCILLTRPA